MSKLEFNVSRVVGHISLEAELKEEKVKAKLKVLNDPRFIESILVGKYYKDVPHIVSRICGPCSISHTLASILAIEDALNIEVDEEVSTLRNIAVVSEVAENHLVHLFMLSLPEYMGFKDAIELSENKPRLVGRFLRLRKAFADIANYISGRHVHPIKLRVGGLAKNLEREKLELLLKNLEKLKDIVSETQELFTNLKYPDLILDQETALCINTGKDYGFIGNEVLASWGEIIDKHKLLSEIKEQPVDYSTSKIVKMGKYPVYVGARARLNLRKSLLKEYSAKTPCFPSSNPYHNILAQAIEVFLCYEKLIYLLEDLKDLPVKDPIGYNEYKVKPGIGIGIKEAPRGLLIHSYEIDSQGKIKSANIITPTTINTAHIEHSCAKMIELSYFKGLDREKVEELLKSLIRAYDPCLGCATHSIEINLRGYR